MLHLTDETRDMWLKLSSPQNTHSSTYALNLQNTSHKYALLAQEKQVGKKYRVSVGVMELKSS